MSRLVSERCSQFVTSNYFPEIAWGESVDGVRSENLECLTYTDESFDVVITQDVLEHVFDTDAAFAQIARGTATGGVHVFTVHTIRDVRRRPVHGEAMAPVEHVQPPVFHGDPLDPSGVLVVTHWGVDLPDALERASGLKTEVVQVRDPSGRLPFRRSCS